MTVRDRLNPAPPHSTTSFILNTSSILNSYQMRLPTNSSTVHLQEYTFTDQSYNLRKDMT